MKKLNVNCGIALVFQYDPQVFDAYDEININTGSAIFSSDAYAKLNQKKLTVNAGVQKIIENADSFLYLGETIVLNGPTDHSGCYLLAETLVIMPSALPGLENAAGIMAEKVYCPDSASLLIRKQINAEEVVMYPRDAYLETEDIVLQTDYLKRIGNAHAVFTDCAIDALDADAMAMAEKSGIHFICRTLRIYEEANAQYGALFQAQERILIPEGHQIVKNVLSLKRLAAIYGDRIYIPKDLKLTAADGNTLSQMRGIAVEGTVTLPLDMIQQFKKIGNANDFFPYEGVLMEVTGEGRLSHEQLDAAKKSGFGYTIVVKGVLHIEDDITLEDLDAIWALYYKGAVECPERLQPILHNKVEEGKGIMTSVIKELVVEENNNTINMGSWIVN